MYNCSSWAPTKKSLDKLDVCHRRHLRDIMNIKWPKGFITNVNLYKICKTRPLSERVPKSRWKLLGHILRSEEDTPSNAALNYSVFVENSEKYVGRVGRPRCNLMTVLRKDLEARGLSLKSFSDITALRVIANDRLTWQRLYNI